MRSPLTSDPGTPDTRGPLRFLLWLARQQLAIQLMVLVAGTVWMVALALMPAAVGRGIDQGIVPGDWAGLARWALAILALGALAAAAGATRHYLAVQNWLSASYRTGQLTARGVERSGPALTRTIPAGEVIAVFAGDVMRIGGLFDAAGRFTGAVVSYVVVGSILLAASPPLGWLVLVGGPVLLSLLTFVVRPLQRRQADQREQTGRLTTLGADTVGGLRVLRGIGGEQTFLRRYEAQSQHVRRVGVRVAGVQASLDSAQVLLPGIFVVLVTWIGARFALDGRITAGQLVAFYGYAAFLTMPLRTVTEFTDRFIRAHIAARKVLRILAVEPDQQPGTRGASPLPDPAEDLVDPLSGVRVRAGALTALVSARPEETAAIADRLGRHGPGRHETTWGGTRLHDLSLAEVRERVVVSEADPRLFTGRLRDGLLAGRLAHSDQQVHAALEVASAMDVLEAVPDGLDGHVEERGRSYSGGQRQRLALARALLADPEVLVLVEPTSAVDAHTEARIATRLADARRSRTTVVTTASPLVLGEADHVVLVEDGVATATGTHHELLAGHAAYRSIVIRGEED
ncbi:ABC transporter ATP-binding protein [Phycicoccus sp. SLBN-51]|uniref:ABC transporter transmembrane domain-containing protein n=1 Tax=Phycicoccus sp. SLBN-51 TaxID=2768447 RepID=UPI0011500E7C|nr:ABC transporter ATP-binding protein [Phycicoccus sp. SLBN-51]TQJ51992.1 ABC-type multidrug transport system fused ATPase/permease subunit [Phycicoccus sp. SLBN-51]